MNLYLIGAYILAAIVVLCIVKKFVSGAFKVAFVIVIVIAMYGVATGALDDAKSPRDFIDKSIQNSKTKVNQEIDKNKQKASNVVYNAINDAAETTKEKVIDVVK